MADGFTLSGEKEMARRVQKAGKVYPEVTGRGMQREGFRIMEASQPQVPVEFGRLRASGFVDDPRIVGGSPEVRLGYGTDYAVFVHERLDVSHPVGKAKYLEDPLKAAAPDYLRNVAAFVDRNVRL